MIEEFAIIANLAEVPMIEPGELRMDTEPESLPGYDSVPRQTLMVTLSGLTGQNIEPSVRQSPADLQGRPGLCEWRPALNGTILGKASPALNDIL